MKAIDALSVNSIRVLAADAIQKANSGHPGLPLGSAPMAYELWANHMNHNPANPKWENRDRFILSGGHGSMLLYSLLHLFGYGLTKEDIMNFRQLGSLTPGHPEYGHTVGVEATTGPLGAGMGMAVGMALAEKHLAAVFNKENYPVVDHYTYVLGGDGCMMEGISSEAFSLAGTMGLSKLIVLYDSNRISIEGSTDLAFRENVEERMKAFGFQTITVEDGTNLDAIGLAIEAAKAAAGFPPLPYRSPDGPRTYPPGPRWQPPGRPFPGHRNPGAPWPLKSPPWQSGPYGWSQDGTALRHSRESPGNGDPEGGTPLPRRRCLPPAPFPARPGSLRSLTSQAPWKMAEAGSWMPR